jgi:hypothetical protein
VSTRRVWRPAWCRPGECGGLHGVDPAGVAACMVSTRRVWRAAWCRPGESGGRHGVDPASLAVCIVSPGAPRGPLSCMRGISDRTRRQETLRPARRHWPGPAVTWLNGLGSRRHPKLSPRVDQPSALPAGWLAAVHRRLRRANEIDLTKPRLARRCSTLPPSGKVSRSRQTRRVGTRRPPDAPGRHDAARRMRRVDVQVLALGLALAATRALGRRRARPTPSRHSTPPT